jgi:hypothetical protein
MFINSVMSEVTTTIVYAVIKYYDITLAGDGNRFNNERESRAIY